MPMFTKPYAHVYPTFPHPPIIVSICEHKSYIGKIKKNIFHLYLTGSFGVSNRTRHVDLNIFYVILCVKLAEDYLRLC